MASTESKLFKLDIKGGFHTEGTDYAEEGKWIDGDHVRFRDGRPQNIRGYEKETSEPTRGTPRELITWADRNTQKIASFGTESALYTYLNDTLYDITPIVSTVDATSVFSTSAGDYLVKISSSNHGRAVGDYIEVSVDTTIGGNIVLTSAGYGGPVFDVVSVIDANGFYISVASAASATESEVGAGGDVFFLLETGLANPVTGLGYGAGPYNAGVETSGERAWNEAATESDITFELTQWSLDTFGEDLLALRRGSQLCFWDRTSVPDRAVVVTASPSVADVLAVSPNDRHVIVFGATGFANDYDPLRIRWSDQNNYTNWTPSVSSTSGEIEITAGSRIVGVERGRNQINFWTDESLHAIEFVGPPFTFRTRQLGSDCGLIGQHAATNYNDLAFWMGRNNFYVYDGSVRILDCTVRRFVYERINTDLLDKVYCGVNAEFKEIIWLYPSIGASEPNSYVIYNTEEGSWVYGTSNWTTWDDKVPFDNVLTTGSDKYLYNNEPEGIYTADGAALPFFIKSADFDFEDGQNIIFLDKIIPDFFINDGNVEMTITTRMYPKGETIVKGPYTINNGTSKVDMRARGRQGKVLVSSAGDAGQQWRWGTVRLSGKMDGMR